MMLDVCVMSKAKSTMYFQSEFGLGVKKLEVTGLEINVRSHAQYTAAVEAIFVPRRARKQRVLVQTHKPSLLVLEGWGHPEPDGIFLPAEEGATLLTGRYSACDERWQSDFDQRINAYVASSQAVVEHDFRNHNTHGPANYISPAKQREIDALVASFSPAPELDIPDTDLGPCESF